jgi:ATP-dependent DNA helicase PIF1
MPAMAKSKKKAQHPGQKKEIKLELSPDQNQALEILRSGENVFLTGGAGSGKSTVIREFRSELDPKAFPLLASTGAAAVLLGGRTFHSFFGLGIMEGGPRATYDRTSEDPKLLQRLRAIEGFVLDEVSMIPGGALQVAEALLRKAKGNASPWGGLRILVVGDFAQLPPVSRGPRDWAFQSPIWEKSNFLPVVLKHNHRVFDLEYLDILEQVRHGKVGPEVTSYLNSRLREDDEWDKSTRMFPRREQVENHNRKELTELTGKERVFPSIFIGSEKSVEALKRSGPLTENLVLKEGCRVLFVQNDPQKRWVNGTKGTVVDMTEDSITVEKESWRHVTVEKAQFSYMDAQGNVVASVINFPLVLGYATTIHKSQGATMDELWVDLKSLWEPGHAYVALSRLRTGQGLKLLSWNPRSFIVDPSVSRFYSDLAPEIN